MPITTTGNMPPPVQQSFHYKMLRVPVPNMIHKLFAMEKKMPSQGGDTIRFRRQFPLPTAIVPLGNSGVTPPSSIGSFIDIDAKIQFYGQWLQVNEQVQLTNQDPVLNEYTKRLGTGMRQTEDELCRNVLQATAGFINAVGGVNGDNPTELSRADINAVIRALMNADAYTISDMIGGEDKFGTAPVRDAFFVMANAGLIGDLDVIAGFTAKSQYPSDMGVLRSEYGAISNTRWVVSSIGSVTPNASALGRNVYNCFVTGMEAYAYVTLDEYNAKWIYRPAIYDGPLAQNITLAYKFASAYRILNDLHIINLRCTNA